jgi:hypothetical protein
VLAAGAGMISVVTAPVTTGVTVRPAITEVVELSTHVEYMSTLPAVPVISWILSNVVVNNSM